MISNSHIKKYAVKKALQSECIFKISALGFNKKNELIGMACNLKRFQGKGRGIHAEEHLIRKYGPSIKTIIICRTNFSGSLCPIEPCVKCKALADKYKIRIISLS